MQTLCQAAQGNPRVLENIAGMLLNDPSLSPTALIASTPLPAIQIARVLILDAMSRLSLSVRRVLQVASVIERPFTKEQFSRIVDGLLTHEQIEQGLMRLTRGNHLLFDHSTNQYRLRDEDRPHIFATIPPEGDEPFSRQALIERAAKYRQD